MFTRTFSTAAVLLLAACSPDAAVVASADEDDLIACALGGSASFTRDCVVERAQTDGGQQLEYELMEFENNLWEY